MLRTKFIKITQCNILAVGTESSVIKKANIWKQNSWKMHKCAVYSAMYFWALLNSLTSVIFNFYLHDRLVRVCHRCHDGNSILPVTDTEACFFSDKCVVCVVVHVIIKIMITLFALFKDSQCVPVGVQVVVIGHREHDSYFLSGLLGRFVEEIISEDTNSSSSSIGSLGEECIPRWSRVNTWWQRLGAVTTGVTEGVVRGFICYLDGTLTVCWKQISSKKCSINSTKCCIQSHDGFMRNSCATIWSGMNASERRQQALSVRLLGNLLIKVKKRTAVGCTCLCRTLLPNTNSCH